MGIPEYTEAKLESFKEMFRSMPTYQDGPNGGTVNWPDVATLIEKIGYERTLEERNAAAQTIANREVNRGIVSLDEFIGACKAQHDPVAFARYEAELADTNGDGLISKEEFEAMLPLLVCNEPLLKDFNFDKFVEEADANKDGKISIDECADWIAFNLKARKS